MGAAVSGMHYTGMAAMRLHDGQMPGMPGASGDSFLLPLLLGITLITFVLTLIISLSPTEAEIRDDAEFRYRLETLRQRANWPGGQTAGRGFGPGGQQPDGLGRVPPGGRGADLEPRRELRERLALAQVRQDQQGLAR
jgi:hypothetical protein